MGAAAVVGRDDPAVVGRVRVRAGTEQPAELAAERNEESAADTVRGGGVGQRRPRAVLAGVPAFGGALPADGREDPRPPGRGQLGRLSWPSVLFASLFPAGEPVDHGVVAFEGHQRDEAFVVGRGGQQVPDAQVARPQPVMPRHPVRREQGVRPGEQDRLVDRDQLGPRRAGHRHRPPPADVGRIQALEQMGDDTLGLGLKAQVAADAEGGGHRDGSGPREVDSLRAYLVWFPGAGPGSTHSHQFSLIAYGDNAVTRRLR